MEVLEGRRLLSVTVPASGQAQISTMPLIEPAIVAPAPAIAHARGVAVTLHAQAGAAFHGVVAKLTGYTGPINELSTTIQWGDGSQSTAGSLKLGRYGQILVLGNHTYALAGNCKMMVTVTRRLGPPASAAPIQFLADIQSSAIVKVDAGGVALTETTGERFTSVLGSFQDADLAPASTPLTAAIEWGDGQISIGRLQQYEPGYWQVVGAHQYATAGVYSVIVAVTEQSGSSNPATPPAVIAQFDSQVIAQPEIDGGVIMAQTVNAPFAAVLGDFIDAGPANSGSNLIATIDWGDGQISLGQLLMAADGNWIVLGTHQYAATGDYTAQVVVTADPAPLNSLDAPPIAVVAQFRSEITVVDPAPVWI
jgi:hypothetical protein